MSYLQAAIGIIHPHLGGIMGAFITRKEVKPGGWYSQLNKAPYNPPNWVFGPMWTTLYSCMGYASYLVWRDGGGFDGAAKWPLTIYAGQLLCNWAWTPIFFGAKRLGLSVPVILTTWCGVLSCIITFKDVNTTAACLMVPYLAWLTLASALNIHVWRNN